MITSVDRGLFHEQPGLLRSILGGGEQAQSQQTGLLGSPLAKAALAGIAAMAIKGVLASRAAAAAAEAAAPSPGGPTIGGAGGMVRPEPSAAEPPRTRTPDATAQAQPRGQQQPTAAPRSERWHEVTRGDTLSRLAAKFYGDGNLWMRIFEANGDVLSDPDLIRVGQRLRIP